MPPRIHQWGPEDIPDYWTRTAVHALLNGTEETGFGLVWRYWMKDESPEQIADSLFPNIADAIIVLAPRAEHGPLVAALEERGAPFVLAYARSPKPDVAWAAWRSRRIRP